MSEALSTSTHLRGEVEGVLHQGPLPLNESPRYERRSWSFVRAHPLVAGALGGLVWGVSMRLWMRFIATDPEFTWVGTSFILAASVVAGSMLSLARHRRRLGGSGWWRTSILTLLLLGAGGSVMWPSILLLALAIGRRKPIWVTLPSALTGLAAQIPVINDFLLDNWRFGSVEVVVATLWYAPMLALAAWAFSVVFAPSMATVKPGRWRQAMMLVPVVAVSALVVVLAGMPG